MVSNPTMLNMGGVEWAVASLKIFLCMFDYAVELLTGDKLRDTQKIAILYLIDDTKHTKNERKKFAEVWTGEGKSLIVAGVAIAYAFSMKLQKPWPHEIDIITSNDHLAIRDSSLSVAQGGLKEIYEFFNITVSNNCSKSVEDRRKAYYMDVVYGTLANFQRDYLLDEFYNRGIRGDRPTVYALIDEVDCMLLDRGNNMLYLSHDIPGMEMLESLYVFIWERISDTSAEMIKSAVLYDLYGQTTEDDLKKFLAPLGQEEYERAVIWEQLIQKNVIDRQGRLLINEVSDITEEMIDYTPTNATLQKETLNSKIIHFLCSVVKRERHIHIPSHLLDFVDRHLETWLDNARRAMELKRDENYVIDHDRSDTNPDLNPQVIIIDPDTGTDQYSSQWDGALHQFLQLKEGCKLTLQSLKAVFISNATYIKKYDNIAGVSGTLGSQPEQDFLKRKYECEFMTLPTAFPKRFSLKPPKILKTKESWWKAIAQETRATIQENRSIVVFCRSIKEVYQVHKHLKSATQDLRDNNKRIHRYTRDYEKFEFENKPGLDVGNVIVATNLAGRGTDIKISKNLEANGGLHICLTYFPDNERVEGQAMGRAARKGEPGSGILILCEEQTDQGDRESGTSEEWGAEKMFFMKEIRNRQERERISRLEKDFNHTEGLENFFEKYTANFSEKTIREKWEEVEYLRDHCIARQDDEVLLTLIHGSALDKWALFLDETDYDFKCFDLKHTRFEINLKDLIMTPARTISYAKHLATTKSEKIYTKKAADIFKKLIENSNDNFIYPAAFYYLTFILLADMKQEREEKEKKNDEDHDEEQTLAALFRTLRQTETILNDHIKMQESFSAIHQSGRQTADQTPSLCAVNGYKEQKENTKRILEYFLDSTINLKNEVDKITQYYQEHKCVIPTTPEFSLDCIEQDLKSNNSSSEFYVFQLVGFDQVIKERSNTN
jgi:superfamily II DNA/RNA helicase